jgi:hypothetical protein
MNVKGLIITLAIGTLAASSARAGWGINMATYASRYRPVQPEASQSTSEVQVAVMANSSSQPAAGWQAEKAPGAVDAHRFGQPRPYAVKSH